MSNNDLDSAKRTFDAMPNQAKREDGFNALRAQLRFVSLRAKSPPVESLVERLRARPNDCEAHHLLAINAVLAGEMESALEHLLDVLRVDLSYDEGAAREDMLAVFDLLPPGDRLSNRYRSKLGVLLN